MSPVDSEGPVAAARDPGTPGPGETLDRLAGDWRILQLRKGHRFSTDDLMCAWFAAHAAPTATECLDLGAGIGSVGLLTLWRLQAGGVSARLTSVEVQALSWGLARRTIALNGLTDRVDARHGDLRDASILPADARYDLVTGSPPYIPKDRGVQSPHPQKAAARIELHGDVFDYCRTAAERLRPDGRFVFCHAAADPRPEPAVEAAGMVLRRRLDVVFRADQPPLIALFECALATAPPATRAEQPPFVIRGPDGRWTAEYLAMRADMGTVVWNPESRPPATPPTESQDAP